MHERGDNYEAWKINLEDFPQQGRLDEQLRFLLQFGILAPSSHNAQPWFFKIVDNCIYVYLDASRSLQISDASKKYAFISIGCVIENISIAADYFGFTALVNYGNTDADSYAALIQFTRSSQESKAESSLAPFIAKRNTNRSKQSTKIPDTDFITRLLEEPAYGDCELTLITDIKQKRTIAEVLIFFREKAFDSKNFRKELATYKRNNYTKAYDGMPGFTMGFSNFFSLFAPFFIRNFNVIRFITKSELNVLTEGTAVIGFVSTDDSNLMQCMQAGRLFERIALECRMRGVDTAISAVPLKKRKIKELANIQKEPQLMFRMGYATGLGSHSPRRKIEDFIIKQQ